MFFFFILHFNSFKCNKSYINSVGIFSHCLYTAITVTQKIISKSAFKFNQLHIYITKRSVHMQMRSVPSVYFSSFFVFIPILPVFSEAPILIAHKFHGNDFQCNNHEYDIEYNSTQLPTVHNNRNVFFFRFLRLETLLLMLFLFYFSARHAKFRNTKEFSWTGYWKEKWKKKLEMIAW